ncbi:MAG TPA: tryptophan synthase subunit alpha [Opitutaceae bacterium]|jgi:tryptophan synthase alpha chain|nr:tryptophan synthase subunit alpha [Opitutaceae bacterium]
MSRLADAFARAKNENRAAFVAYLCAGDPDFETSLAACRTLISARVDVLELGAPFSDPLADGIANQLAAQRALDAGMTTARVFDLAKRIRVSTAVPLVLYTYYNLVFAPGLETYVRTAKAAGIDALLVLDLPPEEAGDLLTVCQAHDMGTVFIVAPTTPAARIAKICAAATSFIYYVSREGVTGVRDQLATGIHAAVAQIKQHTKLPVAVGFGISTRAQVAEVAAQADGVVVGSALVNIIKANLADRTQLLAQLLAHATELAAGTNRR